MIPVTLEQVGDIVGGELADPADAGRRVDDVTIDSRTARPGSLFVALPGEHVDGHAFVGDASGRGAAGYLCRVGADVGSPPAPGRVVVDDPADALLGLGAWVRETADPTVVAVTGSSGKTTTKDLVAAAVSSGRVVVANEGSYNNELGVPLTCCRLDLRSEVLVAEVGARGIGHIERLASVLAPDIAVVTMVGAAHLETLGDIDAVARAKSELVTALGPAGLAVLNADDERVATMATVAPGEVRTYAVSADADWRARDLAFDELARPTFTAVGRGAGAQVRVTVPVPGEHNVSNALAAVAVADAVGVDLPSAAAAIATAPVSHWRMQVLPGRGGVTVLNDAYNANPPSVEAALRTLAAMRTEGRRWAVLGRMAELGTGGEEAHERIGRLVAGAGIDRLVVVGDAAGIARGAESAGLDARSVDDADAAVDAVAGGVGPGDIVLVKASRSVGLERVADALAGDAGTAGRG